MRTTNIHRLTSISFLLISGVLLSAALVFLANHSSAKEPEPSKAREAGKSDRSVAVSDAYGKLALSFEANLGQADKRVRFIARGVGYGLFLTSDETVLSLRSGISGPSESNPGTTSQEAYRVLRMKLVGAQARPAISGLDELPGKLNYFIGNDPRKWRTGVPAYSKVIYRSVYPGIDVVYHGGQGQLEYDFVVAPRRSPRLIRMAFQGMESITVDPDGTLVLHTPAGDVRQPQPIAYQEVNGERHEVAARYLVRGNKVSFEVGKYNKSETLIIDPVLIYSSFLGGNSGELGLGIAVDPQGSAYLTGHTTSTNFPLAGAFQNVNNFDDAFVVKLNPSGTALIYSTYLGGNGSDFGNAIAVDAQGSAYVVGSTTSDSFPLTPGALQNAKDGLSDGFVTKLSPSGSSLSYSTFLGGDNDDTAFGIAVSADGRAYVVGRTDSTRFRTLPFPTPRNGNPVYKSTNGAGQWVLSSSGLTGSVVNGFGLDPTSANTLYAGTNVGVFKSTNAGANWSLTGTARPSTAPQSTSAIVVDPSNPNIIYAAGMPGGVFKSTDGGLLYDEKNNGFAEIGTLNTLAIDPSTPTILYAGTLFGIYKTTNGGDNWLGVNNGINPSQTRVNEVVIDPSNPATVYMGTNRGVYKTTNGGALWLPINSGVIPELTQITALAIDPLSPSTVYAGSLTTQVLYKTTDGGATWSVISPGLTYCCTNVLAIDPLTPATIYAATGGGGIYKSTNGGTDWNASNTGLANVAINAVALDNNNPAIVYAGANIGGDAFAVKLDALGSTLDYLVNFGGSDTEEARGVGLDADGNAYIVGSTLSQNFPVTNAFQSTRGGSFDAFVAKLNATGTAFFYSTYLGGNAVDQARGVSVRAGSPYVVGHTGSPNFPVANPFMPAPTNSTDAFVTKFSSSGASLDFSTCLGGIGVLGVDRGFSIAVDSVGGVYVTGATTSPDFPIVGAPQPTFGGNNDAFVTKLNSAGTSLIYSTYLGGNSSEQGNGVAVDIAGNAYVIGTTSSSNFPTANPFQAIRQGTDAFFTKIGTEVDVSISKADSRDPVMVNNALTYTLTVTNSGPSLATGVTVTDALPSGMTFGSATPTQGSCSINNLTVTCVLGSLAAGSGATITIAVTPTATGVVTNSATVTVNEPNRNSTNNTAIQTTTVSASPSIKGRVSDTSGTAISGVLMTLSGGQSATQQTDASGLYQFAELPNGGNYTITPSKADFSFDPPGQTFNNLGVDQTANFLASRCTYTLSPIAQSFGAAGGSGSVAVTSLNGCPWTATSSTDWITVTSGASGVGTGSVTFTVAPTSSPRSGRLVIAGKSFAIYQQFDSCAAAAFSVATYNTSNSPTVVHAADLNGDGRIDLVTGNGGGVSGAGISLNVLLNGLDGFNASSFDTHFGSLSGFVLGNFSGDNRTDIAVISPFSTSVRVFVNNGSGAFPTSVDVPFNPQSQSPATYRVFTSDLNRDGNADLLVSVPPDNAVQVLLGNGSGGFGQATAINIVSAFFLSDVADFNRDGIPDLLLNSHNSSASLGVMLGNGSASFGTPIFSVGTGFITVPATADFDGDGNLDVAAVGGFSQGTSPAIQMFSGDGAGHLTLKSSFNVQGAGGLAVGDFNRDAKPDAVISLGPYVTVLLGDGIGGFGMPLQIFTAGEEQFPGNAGIVVVDFNNDQRPDIAVSNYTIGASVLMNTCAASPSISGRVTDIPSGTAGGVSGVMITVSGPQTFTTQTDVGGNYFIGNLTSGASYVVTPSKDNFRFAPASRTIDNITGVHLGNFVGTPITVQFTQIHSLVEEFTPSVQINVSRSGDLSGVTTVDYATINGTASDRSDYTASRGTLRFGPGEALKSFNVLFTDDALVEGFESLTLALSNPNGAILSPPGSFLPSSILMEVRDNDFNPDASNPIDDSRFFVRQHYHDFLNREPDAAGLDFWANQIDFCSPAPCREVKRINVSAAFFLSIEFQQTGYLVYRVYKAAHGDMSLPGNPNPVPIIRLPEFLPDTQRIGRDVQVGIGNWEQQLESNKTAYLQEFVQRQRFISEFPLSLMPAQFVDKLNLNAGGVLSQGERDQLVTELTAAMDVNQGRAKVLRRVAEDADMNRNETNRAFVQMQYFGYLRRNPNDLPDSDFGGWQFWLNKLNQFNGNFVDAEMVKAFITSGEYTHRFGR